MPMLKAPRLPRPSQARFATESTLLQEERAQVALARADAEADRARVR